ncbi:MAG: outer membrane protein assembly factor BamD [Thermoanaerobaculales bacterium]|nr:outer membrane protein assembly factor BamD [Thermoanaerobaculales bacterium]
MTYPRRVPTVVLAALLMTAACASGKRESDLLDQLANLDKETIFEQAEALYQEKEYARSRDLFGFVYDTFPNDPLGHKAALRVADTYAIKRDVGNLTEARLRYRDFANRYPNDPDRDYALFMVGQTYSARRLRPDRDLSDIGEALAAYQQLIALYPNSTHLAEAEAQVQELRELLAEHDWLVADFYRKNRFYQGALWRLEYIVENYPNYSKIELVNSRISELQTLIQEREAAWKKRLEELQKQPED